MASKDETDYQRCQSDGASIDTVDSGVGSSLSSLSLDDRTVTEPGGDASRESITQAGLTKTDAVPCGPASRVDLIEDVSSSNEMRTLSEIIIASRSRQELQPSSSSYPSSRQEYHQVPVEQAEAFAPETVSSTDQQSRRIDQSLSQREPVEIQWRPERNEPEFFDIALVYCREDEQLAKKFGGILQKFIVLEGQQKPRIYTEYLDLRDPFGGSEIDNFNHVLSCSSFSFVFFSLNSVKSQDLKGKFDRTVALHGSVTDKNCAKVVPIVTEQNLPLEYSFGHLVKINIRSLLLDGRILELACVADLKMEHIDKRVLDRISDALSGARTKRKCKLTNCGTSHFEQPVDAKQSITETAYHRELLQSHYHVLVDLIDSTTGLLSYLFSKNVFSRREMDSIRAEKISHQSNEKLLDLLYLKDAKSFEEFLCGLSESNQDSLADLLRGPTNK